MAEYGRININTNFVVQDKIDVFQNVITDKINDLENKTNTELKKIQDDEIQQRNIIDYNFRSFNQRLNDTNARIDTVDINTRTMFTVILGIVYTILLNPVVRFINRFTHSYTLSLRKVRTAYFGEKYIIYVNTTNEIIFDSLNFNKEYKKCLKSGLTTKHNIIESTIKYQMGEYN